MKNLIIAVFFILTFSLLNAQNFKQVKLFTQSQNDISLISQLGIDLEHSSFD